MTGSSATRQACHHTKQSAIACKSDPCLGSKDLCCRGGQKCGCCPFALAGWRLQRVGACRELICPWMFSNGGGGMAFNVEFLIGSLLCAAHLKDQSKLRELLTKAVSLALPPMLTAHFKEQVNGADGNGEHRCQASP